MGLQTRGNGACFDRVFFVPMISILVLVATVEIRKGCFLEYNDSVAVKHINIIGLW